MVTKVLTFDLHFVMVGHCVFHTFVLSTKKVDVFVITVYQVFFYFLIILLQSRFEIYLLHGFWKSLAFLFVSYLWLSCGQNHEEVVTKVDYISISMWELSHSRLSSFVTLCHNRERRFTLRLLPFFFVMFLNFSSFIIVKTIYTIRFAPRTSRRFISMFISVVDAIYFSWQLYVTSSPSSVVSPWGSYLLCMCLYRV